MPVYNTSTTGMHQLLCVSIVEIRKENQLSYTFRKNLLSESSVSHGRVLNQEVQSPELNPSITKKMKKKKGKKKDFHESGDE
jgi:hypothetical protein